MSKRVVPVSTLVHYLKEAMEGNPVLHGILVEGEISNLRIPYSGHWYFSLKDEKASISCVMFASANRRAGFVPKNGDKVTLSGDVSVYEAGGTMQIIAQTIQPSGIGELYLQLEALKQKLSKEGLFAEEHKKTLPMYPMDVALVTGNQTAGREDVLITLHNRWPIAKIHEFPCPVQGAEAAAKIAEAVKKADQGKYDIILLVRGGGSFEDLWCFNDEALARVIYQTETPIVTGIGHEIDFTIADYVADVRANTPTGAVETAVPDQREVYAALQNIKARMQALVQNQVHEERLTLQHYEQNSIFRRPEKLYSEQSNTLNYLEERLMRYVDVPKTKRRELELLSHQFCSRIQTNNQSLQEEIQQKRTTLMLAAKRSIASQSEQLHLHQQDLHQAVNVNMEARAHQLQMNMKLLDAYSPLKVMDRGYSITTKDGQVINSVENIEVNDTVKVRFKDGAVLAAVSKKEK